MSHVPPTVGVGVAVGAAQGKVLAYTGLALGVYLLIAVGLLAAGLLMRRFGRERTA
jgi:hypothetical protein